MLLLVSVRHVGAHPGGHYMASPYKSLYIWVKHFFGYLVYGIFLGPESWRGSLRIYLLSFSRFWTLFIERFWFLFWSTLNGVTLKTSNSSVNAHRRWAIVLLSSQPRLASEQVKWWALLLRLKSGRDRTWHDKEDWPTLTSRSLQSIARPFQNVFVKSSEILGFWSFIFL